MSGKKENMKIKIGIADALNLIPEFTGEHENSAVQFVYFREGCRNALEALGEDNEKLLLMFLKTKLKGNASTRFALKVTTYEKLSQFLQDAKETYGQRCDNPLFWTLQMSELKQKKEESLHQYGAQFQELLQCAIFGIKYGEVKQNPFTSKEPKEKQIEEIEEQAATLFVKNLSDSKTKQQIISSRRPLKNLMQVINMMIKFEDMDKLLCEDDEPKACNFCDLSDHSESECEIKREGFKYMMSLDHECHICDQKGHFEDECPVFEQADREQSGVVYLGGITVVNESQNGSNNQRRNGNNSGNNQRNNRGFNRGRSQGRNRRNY